MKTKRTAAELHNLLTEALDAKATYLALHSQIEHSRNRWSYEDDESPDKPELWKKHEQAQARADMAFKEFEEKCKELREGLEYLG